MKRLLLFLALLLPLSAQAGNENSRKKLVNKNVDMICANNLKQSGAGFAVDTNVITVITMEKTVELPLQSKQDAANAILDAALQMAL